MRKIVEVHHELWIAAEYALVRAQFADLGHHIRTNVHPKLRFELLEHAGHRMRYVQEVRLLGIRQRDVFVRQIDPDGSIHDESVEGFNKGATLDFAFRPAVVEGRAGTFVGIKVRLPAPPLLGWLAPVLRAQVLSEVKAAALEDKFDLEQRGYVPVAVQAAVPA